MLCLCVRCTRYLCKLDTECGGCGGGGGGGRVDTARTDITGVLCVPSLSKCKLKRERERCRGKARSDPAYYIYIQYIYLSSLYVQHCID